MISVSEAKNLVLESAELLGIQAISLYDSTGFTLAEDIFSNIDVPSFNQSAMDGYGLKFEDLKETKSLSIIGKIPAGVFPDFKVAPNSAVRIFTGSQIPEGCDTVVVQEKVTVNSNQLFVNDEQLKKGMNIRLKGSQTKKGNLALKAGTKITPGASGFLAGLGFNEVKVFKTPKVCIINTGKELIKPGQSNEPSKVYESNSYSLNAALSEFNIKPQTIICIDDDEGTITESIKNNLSECDILIISGGVSVGDYDFVAKALDNCGVKCIFHKVKQKPGKPLYFGKINNTLIFGLPGNPAATLTCFYEYIMPAIKKMMGYNADSETKVCLPLTTSFVKKAGLTFFIKGKVVSNGVTPLNAQESYQMSSFAFADCIIQLDEDRTEYSEGDLVEVHLLKI